MADRTSLRVAFLAGSLGQGGAEKQLLYLARELMRAHVEVEVFTLTRGERLEPLFAEAGVPVTWVGRTRLPLRPIDLALAIRRFRPHIVQAAHFFTNLYAVAAARASGAVDLGTIRNDTHFDLAECGRWGSALLRAPRAIVANSRAAAEAAHAAGVPSPRLHVLTNAIDLEEFDRASGAHDLHTPSPSARVIAVARLVPAKRLDRLLRAIARARTIGVALRGTIVGDGPERIALETLACDLGLLPDIVCFEGACADVPRRLVQADLLALTSQHEGCPNVVLEAMAARLPVVTTPSGDAAIVVRHNETGYVVPFDDEELLTQRLIELARSPGLRQAFGAAGRARVEAEYRVERLADRALRLYHEVAARQRRARTLRAVDAQAR